VPRAGAREVVVERGGGGHRHNHGGQASSWLTFDIIMMLETFTLLFLELKYVPHHSSSSFFCHLLLDYTASTIPITNISKMNHSLLMSEARVRCSHYTLHKNESTFI
jgi:hypothetical protein